MRYHLNSFNPDIEGLNINLLIVNHKLSNIYIKQKILEKYLYTEVTTIGYISDLLYILHNQMTGIKKMVETQKITWLKTLSKRKMTSWIVSTTKYWHIKNGCNKMNHMT